MMKRKQRGPFLLAFLVLMLRLLSHSLMEHLRPSPMDVALELFQLVPPFITREQLEMLRVNLGK